MRRKHKQNIFLDALAAFAVVMSPLIKSSSQIVRSLCFSFARFPHGVKTFFLAVLASLPIGRLLLARVAHAFLQRLLMTCVVALRLLEFLIAAAPFR